MTVVFTRSEMEAYSLVNRGRSLCTTDNVRQQADDACNYIIGLAERIKADRAAATMPMVANSGR